MRAIDRDREGTRVTKQGTASLGPGLPSLSFSPSTTINTVVKATPTRTEQLQTEVSTYLRLLNCSLQVNQRL
jgi:hypothetical protein